MQATACFRQRPDSIKVIWQNADGHRFKRMAFLHMAVSFAQQADVFGEQAQFGVGRLDGKEISTTRHMVAAVMGYGVLLK